MIHISSNDVISGTSYDGTFEYNTPLGGSVVCRGHYIEDGPIPWIYDGCNALRITNAASTLQETVAFPASFSDTTAANVIAMINAAFDAISFLAGTVTVYNAATNSYDVTISDNSLLQWETSSSAPVFKKTSDEIAVAGAFSLSAEHIDDRPKYLEFQISSISSNSQATRSIASDFFISTFDEPVINWSITLDSTSSSSQIKIFRPHAHTVVCPVTLKWDLIFQPTI